MVAAARRLLRTAYELCHRARPRTGRGGGHGGRGGVRSGGGGGSSGGGGGGRNGTSFIPLLCLSPLLSSFPPRARALPLTAAGSYGPEELGRRKVGLAVGAGGEPGPWARAGEPGAGPAVAGGGGGGGDGRPDSRGLGRRPPPPPRGQPPSRPPTPRALGRWLGRGPGRRAAAGRWGAASAGAAGGGCLDVGRPAPAFPAPTGALGPAERAGRRGTRPGRANRAAFEVGALRSRSEGGHTGAVRALDAPPPACGPPFPPLHHLSFLFVFVSYSKGMTSRRRRENRVQAQKLFPHHHLLKN